MKINSGSSKTWKITTIVITVVTLITAQTGLNIEHNV